MLWLYWKNYNSCVSLPLRTSRDAESSFEVYFMDTEEYGYKSYNYGFTLNQDGVIEEWLKFVRLLAKSQELIRISLNKEVLIVSLGAKLKVTKLKSIRNWFYNTNFRTLWKMVECCLLMN